MSTRLARVEYDLGAFEATVEIAASTGGGSEQTRIRRANVALLVERMLAPCASVLAELRANAGELAPDELVHLVQLEHRLADAQQSAIGVALVEAHASAPVSRATREGVYS